MKTAVPLLVCLAGSAAACAHEKEYLRCLVFWKYVFNNVESRFFRNEDKLALELVVRTYLWPAGTSSATHLVTSSHLINYYQSCYDFHCEAGCRDYTTFDRCERQELAKHRVESGYENINELTPALYVSTSTDTFDMTVAVCWLCWNFRRNVMPTIVIDGWMI